MSLDQQSKRDSLEAKFRSFKEESSDETNYPTTGMVRNICFIQLSGKATFLNYAYLISGELTEDEIILTFTTHRIQLKGTGLRQLFSLLMEQIPKVIEQQNERYVSIDDQSAYGITTLQIESLS